MYGTTDIDTAACLQRAAAILDSSRTRDGWWGPARFAYDDTVCDFARRAVLIAGTVHSN